MKRTLCIVAALFATLQICAAWGGMGHKVVVSVAKRHLTPRAAENISKLIPYDIVEDAIYMDKHRKDPDLAYAYYFHEQCIDLKTLEYDPNEHVKCGDIMRALWLADYNLGHYKQVSDSIAVLNLRMLLHFVGEVHCPVHLGIPSIWFPKPPYRQDVGKWFYQGKAYQSFHAFLDKAPAMIHNGLNETEIAQLIDNVSRKEARTFVKGDFVDWTNDSVRSGFRIYETFPPLWEIPDSPEPKYIPDGYLETVAPILDYELVKAGYQLAFLLNKYFDK